MPVNVLPCIAIIGGSGFTALDVLEQPQLVSLPTPYGAHSDGIVQGVISGVECVFLPRHGERHRLLPHRVNYRANIWCLNQLGVAKILACNVVGGITSGMSPGTLVLPDQLIDYTYGREHTFCEGLSLAYDNPLIGNPPEN